MCRRRNFRRMKRECSCARAGKLNCCGACGAERGQVDIWRSAKPMRILCEVSAKLMGCMIQHWVILKGCWQQPNRSMVKASQVVKALGPSYAAELVWISHLGRY